MAYLEFDPNQHAYFDDGIEVPSVTQILDRAGMISSFCRDEQARWRGQSVHKLCELYDRTELINRTQSAKEKGLDFRKIPDELKGYVRAWQRYLKESEFIPVEIEKRIDSITAGYAGTLDRLGFLPTSNLPVILDIKTSKAGTIAPYVRLQLTAYGYGYEPKKIFQRVAVALRPDGRYSCKSYPTDNYQIDVAEWLELVNKYKGEINANDL